MTTRTHTAHPTLARKTWQGEACVVVGYAFFGLSGTSERMSLDRAYSIPTQAKRNPEEAFI